MANTSGVFTATGQVIQPGAGPTLASAVFIGDGSHASTITLYHGTSAIAGNEIYVASFPASSGAQQNLIFKHPISCSGQNGNGGIFVVVTGTGGGGVVTYDVGG